MCLSYQLFRYIQTVNYLLAFLHSFKPNPPLPLNPVGQAHYFREVAARDGHGVVAGLEHFEVGGFGSILDDAVVLAQGDDALVAVGSDGVC